MLTERGKEYIQRLSDAELAEYLAAGQDMYEPDALAFARSEFSRRNLDSARIAALSQAAQASAQADASARQAVAAEPLDWDSKLLAVVAGIFFPGTFFWAFRVWVQMDIRGEQRRAAETKRYFLFGIPIAIAFVALVVFLDSRRR